MRLLIVGFIIILSIIQIAATYITPTYRTQSPQQISDIMGEITGRVGFTYVTGGVEWKAIRAKFKNLWNVVIEPRNMYNETHPYIFYFDYGNSKIKGLNSDTGTEIATNTVITQTYFIAKGER